MQARKAKPKNFWGTIKRLWNFMGARAYWMIAVLILAAISAFLNAYRPKVMGEITNIIFQGVQAGKDGNGFYPVDFDAVYRTALFLIALYIFQAIFRYFQQFITTRIAQGTVYALRKELKEKMGRVPIQYFDTHSHGDILSRAINDMDQVAGALGQSLTQVTMSLVQFIAVLFMMFSLSGPLAIVVFMMIPTSFILLRLVAPRAQKQFGIRQRELGQVNDYIEEVYSGQTIVKTFNQEEYEQEQFGERSDRLNEAAWRAEFFAGLLNPMIGVIKDLAYTGVAFFGGLGIINGTMPIGTVQSFLQYVNQFSQPFRQMANLANSIQMTVAATERVFEVLDEPELENPAGLPDVKDAHHIVEFDHVKFGYDGSEILMHDFNLKVNEGEMVAIVGPTGAGKTTLINLIERFYDVKGGAIRYKGVDIRNMPREELREQFSMVLQDTWLFNGTIWDNLRYGASPEVTDEMILEAAKAAHVDDFVAALPDGYQTVLTEDGTNLSQGQRQLITIARAFLRDPEVLILDEATSSVDTRTEILIQHAMSRLLDNRTSFVVAHRLSTIRDADNIIVMDKGDVVEAGNHEELMEKDGFYADLYNAQFA